MESSANCFVISTMWFPYQLTRIQCQMLQVQQSWIRLLHPLVLHSFAGILKCCSGAIVIFQICMHGVGRSSAGACSRASFIYLSLFLFPSLYKDYWSISNQVCRRNPSMLPYSHQFSWRTSRQDTGPLRPLQAKKWKHIGSITL